MVRIALVDYGAGNLTSVRKALGAVGAGVFTPAAPSELAGADAVVIPGVGHFSATATLDDAWRQALRAAVGAGHPLLGICLGQQWLFESSPEAPDVPGAGLLAGACVRLESREGLKVPHVGWNEILAVRSSPLLSGLREGAQAYFTHTYAAPISAATVATTTHGITFASVVEDVDGLVMGVQFHPEKSGDVGLTVLRNFMALAGRA